jgi:NAD+ synthase
MKLKEYVEVIKQFLKDELTKSGQSHFVVGISGGIESALVLALAINTIPKDKVIPVMMPCNSNKADLADAIFLCDQLGVTNYQICDISLLFNSLQKTLNSSLSKELVSNLEKEKGAFINAKARLRMTTLYTIAASVHGLVLGTDNLDESYVGYFTKWGDGGVDLLPISRLTKQEVREAAKLLHVPDLIVNRVPTAGLYDGQTDEAELQVTYDELDTFLLGGKVSDVAKKRITYLHQISAHKRVLPPSPPAFDREIKK